MADDIVTRLRNAAARCWCAEKSQGEPVGKPFFRCESCDDQLQAADEIERTRAEVDLKGYRLDDALDEIERLRAERDDWQQEFHKAHSELGLAVDEIERLRAAGDALVAAIRSHDLREDNIKAWEEVRRG